MYLLMNSLTFPFSNYIFNIIPVRGFVSLNCGEAARAVWKYVSRLFARLRKLRRFKDTEERRKSEDKTICPFWRLAGLVL